MAKQRGAAADILLIGLALVLLVLAMTGNASGLLGKLLSWLLGHPVLPIVTSKNKKKPPNATGGGGTKQTVTTSKNTNTSKTTVIPNVSSGVGPAVVGGAGILGALGGALRGAGGVFGEVPVIP